MSYERTYLRVVAEVCVGPANDRPGNVGLIAMPTVITHGDGYGSWLEFTPSEARNLADCLLDAASEAEEATR